MVNSDFGLGVERGNRTLMTLIFMIFMIFFGVLGVIGGDSDSASFPVKSVF